MKTNLKICLIVNVVLCFIALCGYKCLRSYFNEAPEMQTYSPLPPLYIITPTYPRAEQIPEITRLGNTLRNVRNVFWLVIEDAYEKTPQLTRQLYRIDVPFEHLLAPMPEQYRHVNYSKPRGVSNRNLGLEWLRLNADDGVFYFADDDNTYDLELFEQMRHVKKVAMFPVGLIRGLGLSSPIIRNGHLEGYYEDSTKRKYQLDMAGFAVSVKFLLTRPQAKMPFASGWEETLFLKSLEPFDTNEIEFLASNCTQILVWHTKTVKNRPVKPIDKVKFSNTNIVKLYEDNYEARKIIETETNTNKIDNDTTTNKNML